jgi:hypothetical protein
VEKDIFLLVSSGIAAVFGAFFGSYLKTRGKHFATRADFDQLMKQVEQQTRVTKSIEAELQLGIAGHNERFKNEYVTYKELWGLLTDFRWLGTAIAENEKKQSENPNKELLNEYDRSAEALLVCIEKNRPFFSDDVRHELLEFRTELASAIQKSRGLPPRIVTPFGEGTSVELARALGPLNKALQLLNKDKVERISNIIRQRVGFDWHPGSSS